MSNALNPWLRHAFKIYLCFNSIFLFKSTLKIFSKIFFIFSIKIIKKYKKKHNLMNFKPEAFWYSLKKKKKQIVLNQP
jgi:hypothetical protein